MADLEYVPVGAVEDLEDMTVVEVEGIEVLVVNVDGMFFAVENECSHRGCMLSDGEVEGPEAACPCHGAIFDVRTGAVINGPAKEPLRRYATRVRDGFLEVR